MICSNCGHNNRDNSEFCAECGSDLVSDYGYKDTSGTFFGVTRSDYNDSVYAPADNHLENSALTMAIISLVLANTGIVSLLGTIFAIIGLNKSNKALREGAGRKANVARILSIIAIFLSIFAGLFFLSQVIIMASDLTVFFSSMQ